MNMTIAWIFALIQLFFVTEDQPEFKGGNRALLTFLTQNQIYPEYSKSNCIQGTIMVSFKVNKAGKVYESEVQKGLGVDLDDEALRLVRLTSGKWKVPNTHDTAVALVLPVNFSLREYDCEQRPKDQMKEAIAAYKSRLGLTQAITNFYQNRASGNATAEDEITIMQLKNQLGYDEKYIDRTLREAQRKLKQGDKESACEDFHFVKNLGSDKADQLIQQHCK